jgi:hypothetical protein
MNEKKFVNEYYEGSCEIGENKYLESNEEENYK